MKVDILLIEHLGLNLHGSAPAKTGGDGSFAAVLGEILSGLPTDEDAAGGDSPEGQTLFPGEIPSGTLPEGEEGEQAQPEGDLDASGLQLFLSLKGAAPAAGASAETAGQNPASAEQAVPNRESPAHHAFLNSAGIKASGPGQALPDVEAALKEALKGQQRPVAEGNTAPEGRPAGKTAGAGSEQVVQTLNTAAASRQAVQPAVAGENTAAAQTVAQKAQTGTPALNAEQAGSGSETARPVPGQAEQFGLRSPAFPAEASGSRAETASPGPGSTGSEHGRAAHTPEAELLSGREAAEKSARAAANSPGARTASPAPEQAPLFQQPAVKGDDALQAGKVLQQQPGTEFKASVMQQIEGRLVYLRETAVNPAEMRMTLHPPELGAVTIRVFSRAGNLSATIIAESQLVKEILESSVGELRQRFNFVNIDFEQLDMSSADRQNGGFGRPGTGSDTPGLFNGPGSGKRTAAESEAVPPPRPPGPSGSAIDFWA